MRWRWGRRSGWGGERASRVRGPHGGPHGGRKLCELAEGEEAEVAWIDFQDPRLLRKFTAMGLLPGMRVTLVRRWPACIFRIGESEFAVDEMLARRIYLC